MKRHSTTTAHHERVSDHAKSLIAATSHIADSKVAEARAKLAEVMENAKDAIEYVEDTAVETAKQTGKFIRAKPYQAVAIAVGVGAVIGYLFARRK